MTIHKIDNKRSLQHSTGNYIQYLVKTHNGKESEKKYRYITKSLCCTPKTL